MNQKSDESMRIVEAACNRVRDLRAEFEFYHRCQMFRSSEGLAWIIGRMADYNEWCAE